MFRGRLIRAGRFAGAVLAILGFWFAVLLTVPLIRDEAGQYLVVGPSERRFDAVQATSAQLVSGGAGYTQIAAASPGQVRQLYAHGAWLVLPAGNGGCLRLSDWQSLQAR